MSLKKKAVAGALWNFIALLSNNIVSFIVFAILARVLVPEEFGLIAFSLLLVELGNVLSNTGINQNLIQKISWDDKFASSSFVFIGSLSLFISLLLASIAAPLGWFYHSEQAFYILLCLSLMPFLNGLSAVHSAKLEREFKNKEITLIKTTSSIIGALLAIILILLDFGIWSLVISKVSQALLLLLLLIKASNFTPIYMCNKHHTKEIINFGMPLFWIAIIQFINNKSTSFFTGFVLGTADFAMLSVSKKGQEVLAQSSITPINKMVVPTLSRVDAKHILSTYYRMLKVSSIFVIPMFLGLGAVADQFITVAFSEKYVLSAELLTISTAIIVSNILGWFLPNLLISIAQTKTAFQLNLVSIIGNLVVAGCSVWFGVKVMLISVTVANYVLLPLRYIIVKKHINVSLRKAISAILPTTVSSFIMVAALFILNNTLGSYKLSSISELLILIAIGGFTYSCAYLLFFPKEFRNSVIEFKTLLSKS